MVYLGGKALVGSLKANGHELGLYIRIGYCDADVLFASAMP